MNSPKTRTDRAAPPLQPPALKVALQGCAIDAGFDVLGIAPASRITAQTGSWLEDFVRWRRHGDMVWMETTLEQRRHPTNMWGEARTLIMLGMNYAPKSDPLVALSRTSNGVISCYAKGKDYHTIIKAKLKQVAGAFHRLSGAEVKVFVDTAPLMEKPAAAAAGLGWQGKHTNLVSRDFGSWLFLGAILTTAALPADTPQHDHCGSCRNCLDICPTDAFPAPYQLDARRCISYLTIEFKGHIAPDLRRPLGNRVFGCDDCLAVCPWNKFARPASEMRLLAREQIDNPPLADLLLLDECGFASRFAGTPVKRAGRACFIRNCLIAAGNSGDRDLLKQIVPLLSDAAVVVRAMAVWAAGQLSAPDEFKALQARYRDHERDRQVLSEWQAAAQNGSGTTF